MGITYDVLGNVTALPSKEDQLKPILSCLIAILAPFVADAAGSSRDLKSYLEGDLVELRGIMAAKSVAKLEDLKRKLPYEDSVIRMAIAHRQYQLSQNPASEEGVIRAIPGDPLAFDLCYLLSGPIVGEEEDPALNSVFESFLSEAMKSVASRRHGHREFLRMNGFADGESLDLLQGLSNELLKRDRARFVAALAGLDQRSKDKFCGERADSFCH